MSLTLVRRVRRGLPTFLIVLLCGQHSVAVAQTADQSDELRLRSESCLATRGKRDELLLHVPSPEWRDQIIYMLMIDRFNDGDPSNNDQGAGEYDRYLETHFTGGDIPGIVGKLDYLNELGATAIWMTPPVYNQWWSKEYKAAGWHGYWATHFSEIDPHFGTLEDYQRLSHELHCRDMYLIQDIVVNHVGNFYNYDGEYDPADTARNFFLIEEGHPTQEGPSQPPFDMINRLDPEHAAADIYHWTPPVYDFSDRQQELNYGLGTVADINTENPVVIDKFKRVYGEWIERVGVDGFRIDTVMLVPPAFFSQFLHDEDGIYAQARGLGKTRFITFGEVIGTAKPFDVAGEKKVTQYMDTPSAKGLNSMLGYPLYFTLSDVLASGRPTKELAFRLDAFLAQYADPFMIPNFVDNHDTTRFLNTGSVAAFKQALGVVMTIPGIPIVLQGTEQGLPETRQTMFGPAYGSTEDNFKPDSEYFQYLQSLIALRKSNRVLTRGSLQQVASSAFGSGLLAYRRQYEGETALVLLNSADHAVFAQGVDAGFAPNRLLTPLFQKEEIGEVATGRDGELSLQLPPRAFVVLTDRDKQAAPFSEATEADFGVIVEGELSASAYTRDIPISGTVSDPTTELQLVINGNIDQAQAVAVSADGVWNATIPVRDFGSYEKQFQLYAPKKRYISDPVSYRTQVSRTDYDLSVADPTGDAKGPFGTYLPPQHRDADGQMEITGASARGKGAGIELTLQVANLTDIWLPPNGFDNVAFTIFFSFPDQAGAIELPLLNASMPEGLEWNVGHFVNGWMNFAFGADGASADERGGVLPGATAIVADKADRSIRITYDGAPWGVTDWRGVKIYITTWETSGEATYRPIIDEPAAWTFSGGKHEDPKVLDDLVLSIPR